VTPLVQQDALDETFAGLAGPCLSLHDAVERVVRRAEHFDRRIVAWTEHELNVVRTLREEDSELVAGFEARFVNARAGGGVDVCPRSIERGASRRPSRFYSTRC
jgi:hypothetical protein